MVGGDVFVRLSFIIAASSPRFSQDLTAKRVIVAPIALGRHFDQLVGHARNIGRSTVTASCWHPLCQGLARNLRDPWSRRAGFGRDVLTASCNNLSGRRASNEAPPGPLSNGLH